MSKKVPRRARENPGAHSVPKVGRADRPGSPGRVPRKPLTPSEPGTKLSISLARVDVGSEWCLSRICERDHVGLLRAIRDFESMTVQEVIHNKQRSQDYPLHDLVKSAQERLAELELDDRDVIHRLRITGERRLFGFVEDNRFYVLWWDPHYRIVPSRKKHT